MISDSVEVEVTASSNKLFEGFTLSILANMIQFSFKASNGFPTEINIVNIKNTSGHRVDKKLGSCNSSVLDLEVRGLLDLRAVDGAPGHRDQAARVPGRP